MSSVADAQVRAAGRRRSIVAALLAGAAIMTISLGVRQTLGLFVEPFSTDRGVSVTVFALAVAVYNLLWGFGQPFTGAATDRYGAGPVIAIGALLYALGFAVSAIVPSGPAALIGIGALSGLGLSCTAFGTVFSALGRAVPPERRSMAFGIASAGGSFGQVALLPVALWTLSSGGIATALLVLAVFLALMTPLGYVLEPRASARAEGTEARAPVSFTTAIAEARRHPGYVLLSVGFFSCGFQLAFIGTHLPASLTHDHMPSSAGATALAAIGFFNIIGSYGSGWLGQRFRPQYCLGWIYLARTLVILLFFYAPKSPTSVLVFGALMGLLWFGVVPLTSNLIARMLGVANIGGLFGVAFVTHQIGSFLGAWLGGLLFDTTGSYDVVWLLTAAAGIFAALLHFPIKDQPRVALAPST